MTATINRYSQLCHVQPGGELVGVVDPRSIKRSAGHPAEPAPPGVLVTVLMTLPSGFTPSGGSLPQQQETSLSLTSTTLHGPAGASLASPAVLNVINEVWVNLPWWCAD